jgi:hypothetical protein
LVEAREEQIKAEHSNVDEAQSRKRRAPRVAAHSAVLTCGTIIERGRTHRFVRVLHRVITLPKNIVGSKNGQLR